MTEQLFGSAHQALTYAYHYSGQQYAPSALAKMMGPNIGSGKGLVGLDGAGQAGMILREVIGLGEPGKNFVTARFAPHGEPCSCGALCCSQRKPSRLWFEATAWIADQARFQLPGRVQNYHLRIGIVRRFFGETLNMSELALRSGVKRDTASEHNGIVTTWLKKEQDRAINAITDALKGSGMVG